MFVTLKSSKYKPEYKTNALELVKSETMPLDRNTAEIKPGLSG